VTRDVSTLGEAGEAHTGESPNVYAGEGLRAIAMPLGGIGTGHVAICGDGGLREWQIFNRVNHRAFLPHSFFAIWCDSLPGQPIETGPTACCPEWEPSVHFLKRNRQPSVARVLQSAAFYDDNDFVPAPSVDDHVVPDEAKRLLRQLPGVQEIRFTGEYPVAQVGYLDASLPVRVELDAFSPFIPLNAKDSGLPAVLFVFKVTNDGDRTTRVSIAGSLQNAVGWDGVSSIVGVSNGGYGGNRNTTIRLSGLTAVDMSNSRLARDDARYGQMTLAVLSEKASALAQWSELDTFWQDFAQDGAFLEVQQGESSAVGRTWNGALATPLTLQPGETGQAVFMLAWYFPNRYTYRGQDDTGVDDAKSKFWLGNKYGAWFNSSLDVALYVREHFERLVRETRRFREAFYDSTLPHWLLDCISAPLSTLRSSTCFWAEDGNFHGFEGGRGASTIEMSQRTGGCCVGVDCNQLFNYEQALAKLFPDLARTMRDVEWKVQSGQDGSIPERTFLPLYMPRYSGVDKTSTVYAVDGHCGAILKTYREYRQCGDSLFLSEYWPYLRRSLAHLFSTWDGDGDGVLDGPQMTTWDKPLYGKVSFTGGLYLATLRAAEEMAIKQEDEDTARECRRRFALGRKMLGEELWNGEYFVQIYDEEKHKRFQYGAGCHSDQLVGQWWAHILDLGHILPEQRVKIALESIHKYNWRRGFADHRQQPRAYVCEDESGLLICTWPKGHRLDPVTLYSDEVWTGIEYEVAGLMLYEGLVDQAFDLVKGARDRHDGTRRSPWNEVECGDHYIRPLSSWILLEAVTGSRYDAAEQCLALGPRVDRAEFRAFFMTSGGWGSFSQTVSSGIQVDTLSVVYGTVELKTCAFGLAPDASKKVRTVDVSIGDRLVDATWTQGSAEVTVVFGQPVSLTAGQTLRIEIE